MRVERIGSLESIHGDWAGGWGKWSTCGASVSAAKTGILDSIHKDRLKPRFRSSIA